MRNILLSIALTAALMLPGPAAAQTGGLPLVPTGQCQMTATGSPAALSACTQASFTGTGAGTNLTASAVTGFIRPGASVTGTGVPAGTTIISQTSGPAGGAGVYVTSAATTSSGAALTSGGVPAGSTLVVVTVETANIRWRDDGGAPTTAVGMLIVAAAAPYTYQGTLSAFQLIAVSGSPVVDLAFYRSP